MKYYIIKNGELYHHGIKGQKWGVRRYQNPDGTLTDAGKERYYDDQEQKAIYDQARKNIRSNTMVGNGKRIENIDDITEAGKYLKKQSTMVADKFDKWAEECEKDFVSLQKNTKFKSEIKKGLDDEFTGRDDVEDWELNMAINERLQMDIELNNKYRSESRTKTFQEFDESATQYYKNVKSITDDIVGKYGDEKVKARDLMFDKSMKYREVVENTLHSEGNSAYVRYLLNHTEIAYAESDNYHMLIQTIIDEWKESK